MRHDDIIYAPIVFEQWRKQAREIIEYVLERSHGVGLPIDRVPPMGAIRLEEMLELYHHKQQTQFYLVDDLVICIDIVPFDGNVIFDRYETGGFPVLGSYRLLSIRDMNLVPNWYNQKYVFRRYDDALDYLDSFC